MLYGDKNNIEELNVFQTSTWLNLVADLQKAEPIVATVKSDGRFIGYFTGLIVEKAGIRILGSPFRGSLSYFMGFNLLPDAPRHEVLGALPRFAFSDLGCHYLEIIDPNLCSRDWDGAHYKVEDLHYYGLDLSKSEEELFGNMDSTGRNCIRKSIKNGVVIEEASDLGFADEYYAQYQDVLAKHSLSPTYSLESVRKLIKSFLSTGQLLLLRARDRDGLCIATGIFLALNKTAVFWGAASWRQYQSLRPNEPLAWYGIRNMKGRGIRVLHFGGQTEHYKKKLGCKELKLCRLMKTKYRVLGFLVYPIVSPKSNYYRNWMLRKLQPKQRQCSTGR